MKKHFLFIPVVALLAACGGNQAETEKLPTFEEIQKEANAWREKNMDKLTSLATRIDSMVVYAMSVTDTLQTEDSTKGRGLTLALRDKNTSDAFNTEVLHVGELDSTVDGHNFMDNDWLVNVYDFAKNGYHNTYEMRTNPAQFWAILKEDIEHAQQLEYVVLYRTRYKLMPQVKDDMFEMGADIENAFLYNVKTGELLRTFNLMGINDQEVQYMIYEGDASRTRSSYESAVKSNFYSKLRQSMEKTMKDRWEVKGNVRDFYNTY